MTFARIVFFACLALLAPVAHSSADIRFDVPVLAGFERYAGLLEQPGFFAIALENNDLSPSLSSKLKIGEQGRSIEIRNATLRYTDRKGATFNYEAAYLLGLGSTKVSFPVSVDVSDIQAGKVRAILSLPLANLIPAELTDRIRIKTHLIANPEAQKRVLTYLERQSKDGDLVQAILLDAYNRGGGPMVPGRDVGDALPLSDQWLLILTLVIWLLVLPSVLFVHRLRRARSKPA
jgi:hypothetical protein